VPSTRGEKKETARRRKRKGEKVKQATRKEGKGGGEVPGTLCVTKKERGKKVVQLMKKMSRRGTRGRGSSREGGQPAKFS